MTINDNTKQLPPPRDARPFYIADAIWRPGMPSGAPKIAVGGVNMDGIINPNKDVMFWIMSASLEFETQGVSTSPPPATLNVDFEICLVDTTSAYSLPLGFATWVQVGYTSPLGGNPEAIMVSGSAYYNQASSIHRTADSLRDFPIVLKGHTTAGTGVWLPSALIKCNLSNACDMQIAYTLHGLVKEL